MDELYTVVRGIKVPTVEIKMVEDEYGVKLVPDSQPNIIYTLDQTLAKYRFENDGREPDLFFIEETPEYFYKPMPLRISLLGMMLPPAYKKPIWFRLKRYHVNPSL